MWKFSKRKFLTEGFCTSYCLDGDSKSGGIIEYVREAIPSNVIASEHKPNEGLFIEFNLQNTKILINCSHNPNKSEKHLTALRNSLESFGM